MTLQYHDFILIKPERSLKTYVYVEIVVSVFVVSIYFVETRRVLKQIIIYDSLY